MTLKQEGNTLVSLACAFHIEKPPVCTMKSTSTNPDVLISKDLLSGSSSGCDSCWNNYKAGSNMVDTGIFNNCRKTYC